MSEQWVMGAASGQGVKLPQRVMVGSRALPGGLSGTPLRRMGKGGILSHRLASAAYELAGGHHLSAPNAVERGTDAPWAVGTTGAVGTTLGAPNLGDNNRPPARLLLHRQTSRRACK